MGPSVEGLVRICANRCATRPLRQMPQDVRAMPWQRPMQANAYGPLGWAQTYSLRGSNPRPMAHKTIALTTELREHASALATRTGERLKLFAGMLPGEATKHPV